MNINTNDLSFINFNNQKMQWIRFNNKLIYENWEKLSKGGVPPITLPKCKGKILALPNEYQQVEYIESTGTQYIDTKVADSINTKVVLNFTYIGVSNPGGSNYMGSNGGNLIAVNANYKFAMGGYASDIAPIENEKYTITLNRDSDETRKVQINNFEEFVGSKASQNNNIFLCALGGSPGSGKILAKMHSCKIYKEGVLIRDMLPCYCKSDSIIGMYDLVEGVFYKNAGAGEFLKGNDILDKTDLVDYKIYGNSIQKTKLPKEYQEVEYVEATGEQYFSINYVATDKTNSKGTYQITDIDKANMLFGSREGANANAYSFNWGGRRPYKYYNCYYESGNDGITNVDINTAKHTFRKESAKLYIDNVLISDRTNNSYVKTPFTTPYNMVVFGCNTKGTVGLITYARIFDLKFYDGEELKVDLVPCYRKSDNVIGMYDLVTSTFYTNEGTGTFLKGNDIGASPETPIEFESVGNKTNNLFDTRTLEQGTIVDATGNTNDSSTRVRTKPIYLEANTYTLQVDYVSNTPFIRGVHIYNYETEDWEEYKAFNSRTITFTLSKLSKVRFIFNNSANTVITPEDIIKLNPILQIGESIIGEYEPYGYRISIKAVNGNRIIDRMKQMLTSGGTGGVIEEGTDWAICEMSDNSQATNVEPGSTNYSSGWVRIGYNYSDLGKWYKVSYDIEYLEVIKGEFNFPINHRTSQGGMAIVSTQIEGLNKKYHIERVWQSNGEPAIFTLNSCKVKISNFRLYESDNEIITNSANIYLNEPLRKNEGYIDCTNYKEQKTFRNVDNIIFDGTENWEIHTTITDGTVFRLDNVINPLINAPLSATYMSHFNLTNIYSTAKFDINTYRLSSNEEVNKITGNRLYIATEHATLEEFKSWLAENKPSITYPTPTNVEIIELPLIPVDRGTNTIEVNTEIQPSNMEITYWGRE